MGGLREREQPALEKEQLRGRVESLQGECSRRGGLEAVVRYLRVFAPSFSPGDSSFVAIRPQETLRGGLRGSGRLSVRLANDLGR